MTALLARLTARRDPPRDLLAESARREQHAQATAYVLGTGGRDRLLPPPRWPDPYVFGPEYMPDGVPGMWAAVRCVTHLTGWRGDEPCWACAPEVTR